MRNAPAALFCAMRHPGLIVAFFSLRLAFATAGALLWLGAFAPNWVMGLPRKDASLFQPGLMLPLRLFAEGEAQWITRAQTTFLLALAFIVASALVTGFVLHALNCRSESDASCRTRPSLNNLARQLATVGISWLLVLFAIYAGQQLSLILPAFTYQFLGEKGADAALVALMLLILLAIVFIRIGADLTRAGLSRSRQPLAVIAFAALGDLRTNWRFWLGSYACFTLPVLALALLTEAWFPFFGNNVRFGVARALAHQAVALASCALQLAWWVLVLAHASVPHRPEESQQTETG